MIGKSLFQNENERLGIWRGEGDNMHFIVAVLGLS